MKPFATLTDLLQKHEEKKAVELTPEMLAMNTTCPHLHAFPDVEMEDGPPDASNTSCLDFFKKDNRRYHDANMMETLLAYKVVAAKEELTHFRTQIFPDAQVQYNNLQELVDSRESMGATMKKYKEVLTEPYAEEDRELLNVEFKFWGEFLHEMEQVTLLKLQTIKDLNKTLLKKLQEAEQKLDDFLENRKDEKPRIWFWQ